MAFLPAGFVDGARVPAELLRRLTNAATSGETGVIRPADLKVSALSTPGAAVIVGAGAAAVESKFPNAAAQSYLAVNDTAVTVNVPSNTGASTVTRYVCVVLRDPQFAGQSVPPDPLTNSYVDITANTSLPVGVPHIRLATLTIPGNTSAITPAMIADNRVMARARSQSERLMVFPGADVNMSKSSYVSWPLTSPGTSVSVPSWATHLDVVVQLNGVEYTGTDSAVGGVRIVFNGATAQIAQNGIVKFIGKSRQSVNVIGSFAIPPADRGQTRYIGLQGFQSLGAGNIQFDYQSQVCIEWEFSERLA